MKFSTILGEISMELSLYSNIVSKNIHLIFHFLAKNT